MPAPAACSNRQSLWVSRDGSQFRIRLLDGVALDIEIPPDLWELAYARGRGCGEQPSNVEVDDELHVAAGSSFDLRLEALATAGFRWMPRLSEQDRDMLRLVGDAWEPPSASTGGMS